MKKYTLAVIAAALGLAALAPAQDTTKQTTTQTTTTTTIVSGPWQMRKSTGDKMLDRFWFVADRTLNSAERDTLRSMFRRMGGGQEYTLQKAIMNAIDENAKGNANYGMWTSSDWANYNGMSDLDVYNAMGHGLSWTEMGVLHTWLSGASDSEMETVGKLVRLGGWANTMWATSPLNTGG